jgi:hypothetical protein
MVPGRREWDVPLLLFPNDVNEILKTRLAGSRLEDHIAWHYVKSGFFSVHSAYHLVVQIDQAEQNAVGCSSKLDGSQPLLNMIWTARVPPKVRTLAWRLSQEALTTQTNRKRQKLEAVATCQICGMEEESGHHVVVGCTMAATLRHEMRRHWSLPGEIEFQYTGPDWLLSSVDEDTKAKVLLLMWRAWYMRNDIMHGNGTAFVAGSAEFLKCYVETLGMVQGKDARERERGGHGSEREGGRREERRRSWAVVPIHYRCHRPAPALVVDGGARPLGVGSWGRVGWWWRSRRSGARVEERGGRGALGVRSWGRVGRRPARRSGAGAEERGGRGT